MKRIFKKYSKKFSLDFCETQEILDLYATDKGTFKLESRNVNATHMEPFQTEIQCILDGLELSGDDRQHGHINAIELIKAAPGSTLTEP